MLKRVGVLLRGQSFVDSVKVLLSSGRGGDGASVMSHEHCNEFAGPGGGNGGNGGRVLLRCSKEVVDLRHLSVLGAHLSAGAGGTGLSRKSHGRKGGDLRLDVPLGTEVVDVDTNEVLYDLDENGMEVVLLEGGQGGKGNAAFANKWHHSPVESTRGLPGNSLLAQIELKTMADCGLIGYPNAGKSSILSAVSSSQPTIAPYAFTTLRPYVGVIYDLYGNTCRVADLPGLIEGAYENRGLGHQFLRHVERTKSLAIVVDMSGSYNPSGKGDALEPWEVVESLQRELDYYMPHLSDKVLMVLANKMDLDKDVRGRPTNTLLEELRKRTTLPVFAVSAALGIALGPQHEQTGLAPALQHLCTTVFRSKASEQQEHRRRRMAERGELDRMFMNQNNGMFSLEGRDDRDVSSGSSLVDQQMDLLGSSGLGDAVDGYDNSIARGRLHAYRDLTMRGKYWSVTRGLGERLNGERWK